MKSVKFTIHGNREVIKRFREKYVINDKTGCWLWTGAPSDNRKNGQYGRMRVNSKQIRSHRISWMLFRGEIPDGLHVLHRCDVQRCVNPDHLFLGTNADNVADRVSKGRTGYQARQGEKHPLRKLNDDSVRSIRARYRRGERGKDLAIEFGVHPATVSEIVNLRKWSHVQ